MPSPVQAGGAAPVAPRPPAVNGPTAPPQSQPPPSPPSGGAAGAWQGQSSFTPSVSPGQVGGTATASAQRTTPLGSAQAGTLPQQQNVGGTPLAQGSLGSFQAGGALASASGSRQIGPNTTISGNIEAGSARASGQANASLTNQGLNVHAQLDVQANIAAGGGQLEHRIPFTFNGQNYEARVTLSANGAIGANGSLSFDLNLGTNGPNVSFNANGFAGAQANIGAQLQLFRNGEEVATVNAGATGTAGVQGQAQLQAGFHNGRLSFNASASAALGLGGGVQLSGSVNTNQAAAALGDAAQWALTEGAQQAAQLGQQTVQHLQQAATAFQQQAASLVQQAGQTAQAVVDNRHTIQNAAATAIPGAPLALQGGDILANTAQNLHQQVQQTSPLLGVITAPAAGAASLYNWLRGN